MRGGMRTLERNMHGETQGGHAGRSWRIRLAETRGYFRKTKRREFRPRLKPRQIALRPLLWEVCCDAYTRFKSSYEATHDGKRCFGVCRFEFDQDDWGPIWGSAECKFFARQGVVIPSTTYTNTLKHTNHPRCRSRLWVLHKSDTIGHVYTAGKKHHLAARTESR